MSVSDLHKVKKLQSRTDVHSISKCWQQQNGKYLHHRPTDVCEGRETVDMLTKSAYKKLFVPKRDPTPHPEIWPKSAFERIEKNAHRMTEAEKVSLEEAKLEEKMRLKHESDERARLLDEWQKTQKAKAGSKLHGEEAEAAVRNQHVLQRAAELRQENEDEVKNANSVILAAKCLSIRKAQIQERELINKELREENFRIDTMMEQERRRAIKQEADLKHKRCQMNTRYAREVSQQIRDNEVKKALEFERKQEESRNINRSFIAMRKDDVKKDIEKTKEKQRVREELRKANEAFEHFKRIQKEEERIADFRIQEFMRQKAEREAAFEAELARKKLDKNREIALIQSRQERQADQQAAQDELRAARLQEESERSWRDKEKANALKRKKNLEILLEQRRKQIEDSMRAQALEIQREKEEFFQIVKVQKELQDKELDKKRKRKEAAMKHCKELLQQINQKELQRIEDLKLKMEEGHTLTMEKEIREINIQKAFWRKLNKLKENNVPENVIADVARQLKLK